MNFKSDLLSIVIALIVLFVGIFVINKIISTIFFVVVIYGLYLGVSKLLK